MDEEGLINEVLKVEKEFIFNSFTNSDAEKLGNIILQIGKMYGKPIATRIVIDNYIAFQVLMDGTTDFHCGWMQRKQNLVMRTHKSSLRCLIEKNTSEKKRKWWLNEKKYAFCGGGFPIMVNGNFKGVVIVSGLTDVEDNEIAVRALREFKKNK